MATATLELLERKAGLVPQATRLRVFRKMPPVFCVEERPEVVAKQGKCAFAASTRGHEATRAGITELLKPGRDWFFPCYRSSATAIGLGLPLERIFLGMLNRDGDLRAHCGKLNRCSGRPVKRVAAKGTFVPSAPNLEHAVLPSVDSLRMAVEQVLKF